MRSCLLAAAPYLIKAVVWPCPPCLPAILEVLSHSICLFILITIFPLQPSVPSILILPYTHCLELTCYPYKTSRHLPTSNSAICFLCQISFFLSFFLYPSVSLCISLSLLSGLSLDHQAVSAASRVRLSEREEECLSCYLRACDTALVYLQELDKVCVRVFLLVILFFTPNADNTCYFMIHSCTKLLGVCVYQLKLLLCWQMVVTHSSKVGKASLAHPPLDIDLGFFQQAALQSAYLCLLHRG